jgi:PAS domain S-box-containing protein
MKPTRESSKQKSQIVTHELLPETRSRISHLLKSGPAILYTCVVTGDFAITFISENIKQQFGYEPDDFLGSSSFRSSRIHPDDSSRVAGNMKSLLKNGNHTDEYRFLHHNGTYRWIRDELNLIRDVDGNPIESVGTWLDITEQKIVEEALFKSELRFRSLIAATKQIVWTTNARGEVEEDIPGWRAITGQRIDEAKGWGWIDAVHPDDRERSTTIWSKAVEEHTLYEIVYRVRRYDGEYRFLDTRGAPVFEKDGSIGEWIGSCTDITESKDNKVLLHKQQEELQIILDSVPAWIFYKDKENRFIRVNKAFADVMKIPKERLERKSLFDLYPQEQAEAFWRDDLEVIASVKPKRNIIESMTTEDRILWVQTDKIPYRDGKGNCIGIIGFTLDITERTLAEEELKKYRDHLEELVNERTAELTRSNKELEQFAYIASHDLQEPLRMVSSYTQLLEKRYSDKLDQDAKEFIHYAVDGANRMQFLINDLLEYSRITTQGKDFKETDVFSVLGQAIRNLQMKIENCSAIVTNGELPIIKADELHLVRLFQNLIDNALKFKGTESPRIHIGCQPDKDYWLFSVKDNGIGIESQYKDRIFQIFQRLSNRNEYPGTGIGLAICKRIVERHGGNIWMESEAESGSTFLFTIKK